MALLELPARGLRGICAISARPHHAGKQKTANGALAPRARENAIAPLKLRIGESGISGGASKARRAKPGNPHCAGIPPETCGSRTEYTKRTNGRRMDFKSQSQSGRCRRPQGLGLAGESGLPRKAGGFSCENRSLPPDRDASEAETPAPGFRPMKEAKKKRGKPKAPRRDVRREASQGKKLRLRIVSFTSGLLKG